MNNNIVRFGGRPVIIDSRQLFYDNDKVDSVSVSVLTAKDFHQIRCSFEYQYLERKIKESKKDLMRDFRNNNDDSKISDNLDDLNSLKSKKQDIELDLKNSESLSDEYFEEKYGMHNMVILHNSIKILEYKVEVGFQIRAMSEIIRSDCEIDLNSVRLDNGNIINDIIIFDNDEILYPKWFDFETDNTYFGEGLRYYIKCVCCILKYLREKRRNINGIVVKWNNNDLLVFFEVNRFYVYDGRILNE